MRASAGQTCGAVQRCAVLDSAREFPIRGRQVGIDERPRITGRAPVGIVPLILMPSLVHVPVCEASVTPTHSNVSLALTALLFLLGPSMGRTAEAQAPQGAPRPKVGIAFGGGS